MKTKDGLLKTEDIVLNTKDGLLKTEDNIINIKIFNICLQCTQEQEQQEQEQKSDQYSTAVFINCAKNPGMQNVNSSHKQICEGELFWTNSS